jgi:hypothetical protein
MPYSSTGLVFSTRSSSATGETKGATHRGDDQSDLRHVLVQQREELVRHVRLLHTHMKWASGVSRLDLHS